MLYEIYCEQFHQKQVIFNPGLGVILGTNTGDNSIGKSTFLLIEDYAFGGRTYAETTDIINNVGSHDIFFLLSLTTKYLGFAEIVSSSIQFGNAMIPMFQVSNPYTGKINFDGKGQPMAAEKEHGVGTWLLPHFVINMTPTANIKQKTDGLRFALRSRDKTKHTEPYKQLCVFCFIYLLCALRAELLLYCIYLGLFHLFSRVPALCGHLVVYCVLHTQRFV